MAIFFDMEQHASPQKKKRGPRPRENMVDTHLYFPADLLEWCKAQPEGFAQLMRQLATAERERRVHQPSRHASVFAV